MDDRPGTWAAFFESIPMEIQKKDDFAYRAHQETSREVDVDTRSKTKEGRLGEHIFGHLVAEQPFRRLLGPTDSRVEPTLKPVHVVHHMAYDCGDPTSFVHDLMDVYWIEEHDKKYTKLHDKRHDEPDKQVTKKRKVDEEDEEDEEIRHTNMLVALQGSGKDSEPLEIRFSNDYFTAKAPCWDDLLLLTTDNICSPKFRYYMNAVQVQCMDAIVPIPPFMIVALMRASTSYSTVLCLAAIEAIKHVLENEADDEEDKQRMLRHLIYIPQWLFLVSRNVLREPDSLVDRSTWISIDWHGNPDPQYPENASWLKKYNCAQRYAFMAGYRYLAQP